MLAYIKPVVWDGGARTPRSQLGGDLMKLQPFAALFHGEGALVLSFRFCCRGTWVGQAAGGTRKTRRATVGQNLRQHTPGNSSAMSAELGWI